jgi:hypothetical protein
MSSSDQKRKTQSTIPIIAQNTAPLNIPNTTSYPVFILTPAFGEDDPDDPEDPEEDPVANGDTVDTTVTTDPEPEGAPGCEPAAT